MSVVCSRKFSCPEVSRPRHGIPGQDPARLSSRLHCRQPRGRPPAGRRRHPQGGQRQCRRHQCAAHAGRGVRDLGHPHRHRQGLDRRGIAAGVRITRNRARVRRRWRRGCRRPARSPPSSATCFRCGMVFVAARVWPRWWAHSPASTWPCWCRCSRAGSRWSWSPVSSGLASITAAFAITVYLLLRDGAVLTPVLGFALACAVLVIYTHRGNVRRMREGTEPRARRLWLFGRGRA